MIDENKTYEANQELADVLIAEGYTEIDTYPNNPGKRCFALVHTKKKKIYRLTYYILFDYRDVNFFHNWTMYFGWVPRIKGDRLKELIAGQKTKKGRENQQLRSCFLDE